MVVRWLSRETPVQSSAELPMEYMFDTADTRVSEAHTVLQVRHTDGRGFGWNALARCYPRKSRGNTTGILGPVLHDFIHDATPCVNLDDLEC